MTVEPFNTKVAVVAKRVLKLVLKVARVVDWRMVVMLLMKKTSMETTTGTGPK